MNETRDDLGEKGEAQSSSSDVPETSRGGENLFGERIEPTRKKQRKKRKPLGESTTEPIAEETAAPAVPVEMHLKPLSTVILKILCARLPNSKPPTDAEIDLWNQSAEEVAKEYAPQLAKYSSIVGLVAATVIIVLARIEREGVVEHATS